MMPKFINQVLGYRSLLFVVTLLFFSVARVEASEVLSLKEAIRLAQKYDPWLSKSKNQQKALLAQSLAVDVLPDPKVSVSLANLPTDTFEFNQEPMTQFKIGFSQRFPRGNTLELQSKRLKILSEQEPWLREDRKAKVSVIAANLWLDAYQAQASIDLIEKNRNLFEQLIEIAEAGYSSTFSKAQQQDIIRAELELTRLEDKLFKLSQKQKIALKTLSEWISQNYQKDLNVAALQQQKTSIFILPSQLPVVQALYSEQLFNSEISIYNSKEVLDKVKRHPLIRSIDKQVAASDTNIELARQSYKPEWGINASYAYRDASPSGIDRADFFSIGVSLNIPLFTSSKQDNQVKAAISGKEAVKNNKWLALRDFFSAIEVERTKLQELKQRHQLYQKTLLPQMQQQAEAALNAYTNGVSDFAEVVRARIAQLDAQIEALSIDVEKLKSNIQLNYFFIKNAAQLIEMNATSGESHE